MRLRSARINHWLVTGGEDARLWDLTAEDHQLTRSCCALPEGAVAAVAISPDNRWLVTGGEDHRVRLWDLSLKNPPASPLVLPGGEPGVAMLNHLGKTNAVAISPDNHWLVTAAGIV
jgi:WD40 repeat protein